jgi:hypothetical protein
VDRIIQRRDTTRLTRDAIRNAIVTALGAHASLAPEMSKAIETFQEPD